MKISLQTCHMCVYDCLDFGSANQIFSQTWFEVLNGRESKLIWTTVLLSIFCRLNFRGYLMENVCDVERIWKSTFNHAYGQNICQLICPLFTLWRILLIYFNAVFMSLFHLFRLLIAPQNCVWRLKINQHKIPIHKNKIKITV